MKKESEKSKAVSSKPNTSLLSIEEQEAMGKIPTSKRPRREIGKSDNQATVGCNPQSKKGIMVLKKQMGSSKHCRVARGYPAFLDKV